MKKIFGVFLVAMFLMLGMGCSKGSKTRFVTIGTGGVTGVYYPAGGAISKLINKQSDKYHLKMTVESTGGSVFNINAVISGSLEFGIAQSDRQYQAYYGTDEWKKTGPQKKLRSVCSLYTEVVTLIAADDAHIYSMKDLKGKRVNIGNPGSGNRGNAIDALKINGIDYKKDILAESLKASEAPKMLQDGRIDAFFYTVGHPNGTIKEATAGKRKVHFVSTGNLDKILKGHPYYAKAIIPKKFYPNATNKKDTISYGVKATIVTSADVPDDVVYAIVKTIFENLDEFKKLHPAFSLLTKESMLEGLSAPIHPGALKYYKEVGLIK